MRRAGCVAAFMDPFHKPVMTRLTDISIVNPQVFDICILFLNVCTYIYKIILCIILPLHQITKKIVDLKE